jgi:hypothetical protein
MSTVQYHYTQAESGKINITEGARILGVTNQRFSRALSKLKIPVERRGNVILFPQRRMGAISRYLNDRKKDAKDGEPKTNGG